MLAQAPATPNRGGAEAPEQRRFEAQPEAQAPLALQLQQRGCGRQRQPAAMALDTCQPSGEAQEPASSRPSMVEKREAARQTAQRRRLQRRCSQPFTFLHFITFNITIAPLLVPFQTLRIW